MPSRITIESVRRLAREYASTPHVRVALAGAAAVDALGCLLGNIPSGERVAMRPLPLRAMVGELCFASVNFSYWKNANDTKTSISRAVREECLVAFGLEGWPDDSALAGPDISVATMMSQAGQLALSFGRSGLPLAEERVLAIHEIVGNPRFVQSLHLRAEAGVLNGNDLVSLCETLPSFRDEFAKRAILFFHVLYRVYGRASEIVPLLPMAADYSVPKVLSAAGVLKYSTELQRRIDAGELIMHRSEEERAIRACSIIACADLAAHLGVTEERVDAWLWTGRKRVATRYHLTRTTAY
jgi:hypothetical protein